MRERNGHRTRSYSNGAFNNIGSKRRNYSEDKESVSTGSELEYTLFRYLCPVGKIGNVIGRGGGIVKKLRKDTKANIKIGDTIPGCDDRVVSIYSSSDGSNLYKNGGNYISPALDALLRIHDRVVEDDGRGDDVYEESSQVIARLLVPSDQIGCVIGKGGEIIQTIRSETGAQIRIVKAGYLPLSADNSDELVKISGDASLVKGALYQIAYRLCNSPSRSQHSLVSQFSVNPSRSSYGAPATGSQHVGSHSPLGSYSGHGTDAADWSRSYYPDSKDDVSPKRFSLRLVCRSANIGNVIGKGGTIINQIRQKSGACIKVEDSIEGEDTLINITAEEYFEDISPVTEAALRLQPRCSDKTARDSVLFTTRILVPSSRIGCLIGKGGRIITEIRNLTNANIRIPPKENLPEVAVEDDAMVQISGDLYVVRDALLLIIKRLRANLFDKEEAISTCIPEPLHISNGMDYTCIDKHKGRDTRRHGCAYHGPYGIPVDLPMVDRYGCYDCLPQVTGVRGSACLAGSGTYTSGEHVYNSRVPTQTSVSRTRRRSCY